MGAILPLLNTLLPQVLSLYKTVRSESKALNENIPSYSDADIIELLRQESTETVATAQAILDRLNNPTE